MAAEAAICNLHDTNTATQAAAAAAQVARAAVAAWRPLHTRATLSSTRTRREDALATSMCRTLQGHSYPVCFDQTSSMWVLWVLHGWEAKGC